MSPNINSFVGDLVAMAKAMEDLPMVKAERDRAERIADDRANIIAERETTILNLKAEIETLHATIRTAEAARDSAELLFLECDDAKRTLVRFLEDASRDISGVLKAVAPIPTPTVEGSPVAVVREEVKPEAEGYPEQHDDPNLPMSGQSESPLPPVSVASLSPNATNEATAPTDLPYIGKIYADLPIHVSLSDWLAGGGTELNYWLHREHMRPDPIANNGPSF